MSIDFPLRLKIKQMKMKNTGQIERSTKNDRKYLPQMLYNESTLRPSGEFVNLTLLHHPLINSLNITGKMSLTIEIEYANMVTIT